MPCGFLEPGIDVTLRVTVDAALAQGRAVLSESVDSKGTAPREARFLLEKALARTPAWLLAHGDARVEDATLATYRGNVERRASGEPLAYIVGEADFYGRTFAVTPDVLIPRPETEGLILIALDAFSAQEGELHAWDVGTGSGILAVTLALERPGARIVATDASMAALAVARRNAAAFCVAERIEFRCEDDFESAAAGPFDAILANLPYVPTADLAPWPDPTSFEPRMARDGGSDGLAVYRRLLWAVRPALALGGLLALEAGSDTAAALRSLCAAAFAGASAAPRIVADASGLPRVVTLRATSCGQA